MKLNKEQIQALTSEGGKYSLDISKLIFGGIILASIMKSDTDTNTLLWVGGITTLVFSVCGFFLVLISKKDGDKSLKKTKTYYRKNYNKPRS